MVESIPVSAKESAAPAKIAFAYGRLLVQSRSGGAEYYANVQTPIPNSGTVCVKYLRSVDSNRGGPWIGGKIQSETEFLPVSSIVSFRPVN